MEDALLRLLNSSRTVNKHGRHRQFLFLVGRFLKIFSSETTCQIIKILQEVSMEGPQYDFIISSVLHKTWSPWAIFVSA